jgi:hypothetical protein
MGKLLCAVFGCTDEGTEKVKVRHSNSDEESYRDVCRKHYDEIQRDALPASWDPVLQAVRMT